MPCQQFLQYETWYSNEPKFKQYLSANPPLGVTLEEKLHEEVEHIQNHKESRLVHHMGGGSYQQNKHDQRHCSLITLNVNQWLQFLPQKDTE